MDSSSPQQQSQVAAFVKKVKNENYRLLLEFAMNGPKQNRVEAFCVEHAPVKTNIVDVGSRVASVTIHEGMENEHGLGNERGFFEIKDLDVVLADVLVTRLGKQACSSKIQQFVRLEKLLTVSQFKKSLMDAPRPTMTFIEIEDVVKKLGS